LLCHCNGDTLFVCSVNPSDWLIYIYLYRVFVTTYIIDTITQVGWDESTAGERPPRVSLWEIEPLTTFPMYPSLFPLRVKHPWYSGVAGLHGTLQILMLVTTPLLLDLFSCILPFLAESDVGKQLVRTDSITI
jgi:hypothetical protein